MHHEKDDDILFQMQHVSEAEKKARKRLITLYQNSKTTTFSKAWAWEGEHLGYADSSQDPLKPLVTRTPTS